MCLLYWLESALRDLFLEDKVGNTAAGGDIVIGSSDDGDGMDAIRMPKQLITSRNDWICVH